MEDLDNVLQFPVDAGTRVAAHASRLALLNLQALQDTSLAYVPMAYGHINIAKVSLMVLRETSSMTL